MLHFGTDGVRGVALDELTPALSRDLARAVVRVLQPAAVVVGRDTRESGVVLQQAIRWQVRSLIVFQIREYRDRSELWLRQVHAQQPTPVLQHIAR